MRARYLLAPALAALAALASVPRSAHAQAVSGFAVNRFETSERGSEWFAQDSMDFRGKIRPVLGVVGDYSYRPLVIYNSDGTIQNSVVRNQLFVHLGASLNLAERLRLSINVPLALQNEGRTGTLRGTTYQAPTTNQGIGDLRFALDVRLFGEYGDPFTIALGARLWAPTGDQVNYLGDGKARVAPQINFGGDVGIVAYSVRTGVNVRLRDDAFADKSIGTEFLVGGAVGLHVLDKKLMVGPEVNSAITVATSTGVGSGSIPDETKASVEGLFGFHYTAGPVRFGAGAGTGFSRGLGTPAARVLANLEFVPEINVVTDRDGDGINDAQDACPDVRGVPDPDASKNGCPPEAPPKDTDGDGIIDAQDACVDVPGIKTDDPRTNGCPSDRDKDGIYDKDDACIDVPGVRQQDPARNGCPADSDGDGIIDTEDACPGKPGIKSPDPKLNGCPDPDRDKDGIPNDVDACPDEPGKSDPDPKKNGCPKAFVKDGTIKILDQVKFKTASAQILPGKESEEVLEAVLKVLNDHPEIKRVSVEGHTDTKGVPQANKKLSADRAASVVKWLVGHGIAKERLTSAGFGQEKPIDTNDTEDGRKNNRRVEFRIVDENAAPPTPPTAKPAPAKPAPKK